MWVNRGRHVRRGSGLVGPLFAVEAIMVAFGAKRELDAVTAAQLARSGPGTP